MANYTTADIKELREKTSAGMMDVKKALDEADGDQAKALEIIRIKGLSKAAKRGDRETAEGIAIAKVVDGAKGKVGYALELNSETDFVAKTDKFIALADDVLDTIIKADVDNAEDALKIKTDDGTLEETIAGASGTLGEKIVLRRVGKVEGAEVAEYLHSTASGLPPAIAVLVGTTADTKGVARDIAQHIAALNPSYVSVDDVPADTIESETRIATEIAKGEGKPEKIIPMIVEGRLKGFYADSVLLNQPLAKDSSKTVAAVLDEAKAEITSFLRFRVGA